MDYVEKNVRGVTMKLKDDSKLFSDSQFGFSNFGVYLNYIGSFAMLSLLFASLAIRVHNGCSAFPFYAPLNTKLFLHVYFKSLYWVCLLQFMSTFTMADLLFRFHSSKTVNTITCKCKTVFS